MNEKYRKRRNKENEQELETIGVRDELDNKKDTINLISDNKEIMMQFCNLIKSVLTSGSSCPFLRKLSPVPTSMRMSSKQPTRRN